MITLALTLAALAASPVAAIPGDASSRGPVGGDAEIARGAAASREAAPERVSIRFNDVSTIDGGAIRLGDVATVQAAGQRAVPELENLEVGKGAAFGLTRVLDTELIFNRCLAPFSGRYEFSYDPKTIKVTTRSAKLSRDSLARLVDAFIAAIPGHAGAIHKWEIARAPGEILVPAVPHTLELAFAGAKRKGKVELDLAVKDSARTLRHIPITLNLRVEEPVLVAKTRINPHQPLSDANVSVEMRETTLMSEIVLGDPKRYLGRLAKITLNPGRIITPRVVSIPPTVKRGQEARLIYRNGGVSVATGAVCRQDGIVGEIITAKNLASQRLVRARVTEEGWLEPVPGG